jgi:hypothetical protein
MGGAVSEAACAAMLAGLRREGLLVEAPGGWTTPNWSRYQRADATATERKRAQRAREAANGVTSRSVTDVTRDKRDVTDVTPTVQYSTEQDSTPVSPGVVVVDPSRAPAREATGGGDPTVKSVESAIAHAPEGLDGVVDAWRRAMPATSRRGALTFLPPATVEVVARLVSTHGAAKVTEAIAEAVRSRGEVPSPGYVEAILTGRGRKSVAYRDPGRKPVAESPKPPISEDIPF